MKSFTVEMMIFDDQQERVSALRKRWKAITPNCSYADSDEAFMSAMMEVGAKHMVNDKLDFLELAITNSERKIQGGSGNGSISPTY